VQGELLVDSDTGALLEVASEGSRAELRPEDDNAGVLDAVTVADRVALGSAENRKEILGLRERLRLALEGWDAELVRDTVGVSVGVDDSEEDALRDAVSRWLSEGLCICEGLCG
jgi:hypothetical protein